MNTKLPQATQEEELVVAGPQPRKLTIFIVDNQPLYRQAIRQTLVDEMEIIGESALNGNIYSLVESLYPDIALVDVGASMWGFSVTRQIATRCPKVAVVMLSANPDDDQLFQAIKSGAVAFLSKDISADNLTGVLRRVGRGEYPHPVPGRHQDRLHDRHGRALAVGARHMNRGVAIMGVAKMR